MSNSLAPGFRWFWLCFFGLAAAVLILALTSLSVGASRMNIIHVFTDPGDRVSQILFASRLPRTLALVLAGAALAVAGLLLQMMARNKLVEPSMVGTVDAATLGLLVCAIVAPGMALWLKFSVVSFFALLGTLLFLAVLKRIPLRSALLVPLVGLVMAGVIHTGSSLLASRFELSQALQAWNSGDFSAVLRGRYELLWIAAGITLLAVFLADRFTVIGMGEDFATNAGLNYGRLLAGGVVLVSMVIAAVVITAGAIPFIGLVASYMIRSLMGDSMRRAIPLTALLGAVLMLAADLLGRILIHPYEVPSSTLLAIMGASVFLVILYRGRAQWA